MTLWTDVPGWLTEAEGATLQRFASGGVVLELGAYLGRSTCCLAAVAERVVSVDWHQGDAETGPASTLPGFLSHVEACDATHRVTPIVSRIEDADHSIPDQSFDVVFIDSQHDTASVERDTRLAVRAVKPGGTILWHDWSYPSVRAGIERVGLMVDGTLPNLAWLTA